MFKDVFATFNRLLWEKINKLLLVLIAFDYIVNFEIIIIISDVCLNRPHLSKCFWKIKNDKNLKMIYFGTKLFKLTVVVI